MQIVTYGEHVKKYIVNLGVNPEKIFCAFHSVDNNILNKTVSAEEILRLKSDLSLTSEKIILYVGRLEKCKGLNYLIDGLSKVKHPDFTVLFIGNGSQEEALRSKCKKLSVKCHFAGHIPNHDLYRYYALADIFVLPSITTKDFKEPWGLVINEAMNQGCPIIATDAVGAAAGGLVEDGKNGFIVREKNSDDLMNSICKLISDEPLRLRMSANSREKIKHWTQENMPMRLNDLPILPALFSNLKRTLAINVKMYTRFNRHR